MGREENSLAMSIFVAVLGIFVLFIGWALKGFISS
jgi:hypothetical protein